MTFTDVVFEIRDSRDPLCRATERAEGSYGICRITELAGIRLFGLGKEPVEDARRAGQRGAKPLDIDDVSAEPEHGLPPPEPGEVEDRLHEHIDDGQLAQHRVVE